MATRSAGEPAPCADSASGCLSAGIPAPLSCELARMAPPAPQAAQGEAEPKVSHLPGRDHAVRTHEGGAQVPGALWG